MGAITDGLKWVLVNIHGVIANYGWSIVVFTVLIKLVLMPLDIKNRKGMRKMAQIQPELNKLQKKYANDKQKLQQKQSELMRKERYNPLSGCLPLLIQMPILVAMFGAMRNLANEKVAEQVFIFLSGGTPSYDGWLWVRNIWAADSLFASIAPGADMIKMIPLGIWEKTFQNKDMAALLPQIQQAIEGFGYQMFADHAKELPKFIAETILPVLAREGGSYVAQTAFMPGWSNINLLIINLQVYLHYNGYLILPAAAGLSQVLMTKLTPGATGAAPSTAGQQGGPQAGQQAAGMNSFMKYFFPLFSVFITLTSNAGFALYWVVSNLMATALNILITRHYDRKDKLEAAAKGAISAT